MHAKPRAKISMESASTGGQDVRSIFNHTVVLLNCLDFLKYLYIHSELRQFAK